MSPIKLASRLLLIVCAALLSMAGVAKAQTPALGLGFHPGDVVRLTVTFKTAVSVERGLFYFNLQGQPLASQQGFSTQFSGTDLKKISDTQYEISGTISPVFASGAYRLDIVDVTVGGVTKRYSFGPDFTETITIQIANSKQVEFPEIKDIKVHP